MLSSKQGICEYAQRYMPVVNICECVCMLSCVIYVAFQCSSARACVFWCTCVSPCVNTKLTAAVKFLPGHQGEGKLMGADREQE